MEPYGNLQSIIGGTIVRELVKEFGKEKNKLVRHHKTCPGCGRTSVNLYQRYNIWRCKKCWDYSEKVAEFASKLAKGEAVAQDVSLQAALYASVAGSSEVMEITVLPTMAKEPPKLIKTWEELSECTSETHVLEIERGCGWIHPKPINKKGSFDGHHYLSTHTFYGLNHKHSTEILQSCGFNVEIANWDELGW